MKKVGGMLRLDLAQYRELEAFAKFGSELDKSTQAQLNRGVRLVEILKQPQYAPCPVDEQVMIIYVVNQGLLDDVTVEQIQRFEKEFIAYMRQHCADVVEKLRSEKQLTDEIASGLVAGCEQFKKEFMSAE